MKAYVFLQAVQALKPAALVVLQLLSPSGRVVLVGNHQLFLYAPAKLARS